MTETYSLNKTIPSLNIDIDITVVDRQLLLELDEVIRETIIRHYNLGGINDE